MRNAATVTDRWKSLRYVIGIAAVTLIGAQFVIALKAVNAAKELETTHVTYSVLTPDRKVYKPGDLVHFEYTRVSDTKGDLLLLLVIDSFENIDTGEIFPSTIASRLVHGSKTEYLKATRRVPEDCTPGTYQLEGWVSSYMDRPTRAAPYWSETFRVESP